MRRNVDRGGNRMCGFLELHASMRQAELKVAVNKVECSKSSIQYPVALYTR